jgi:RecA-family ATPase
MIQGCDVIPRKTKWLWPNRIPIGGLSIIAGNPGAGKTHLGLCMASHISTGRKWPDCEEAPQIGMTLILTAEDHLEYSLTARLIANGADMKNIAYVDGAKMVADREDKFTGEKLLNIYKLPMFTEMLQRAIDRWKEKGRIIRMIMIDPLASYMTGKDENRNIDVRTFLSPLADLAAKNNLAMLGITHLNKDMSKLAIYRTVGSIGFTGAARSVWLVINDPEHEGRKLFLVNKMNEGKAADGIAYCIDSKTIITPEDGPAIVGVVKFESKLVNKTADEVLADHLVPMQTKIETARKWLKEALIEKPLPIQEVIDLAKHKHFAERTVRRAAEDLEVERYAIVAGTGILWMWRLEEKKK